MKGFFFHRQWAFMHLRAVGPLFLCLILFLEPAAARSTPLPDKTVGGAPHPPARLFMGRLDALDLSHHPMTLSAVLGQGRPVFFLFGGTLVPDTMVLSKGKEVGVKALKKGQLLEISYQETPKGAEVRTITLLPEEGQSVANKHEEHAPALSKGAAPHPSSKK